MSEESGNPNGRDTPPSFVPVASRARKAPVAQASSQPPAVKPSTRKTRTSRPKANGHAQQLPTYPPASARQDEGQPRSFNPPASRSSSSAQTRQPRRSQGSTGQIPAATALPGQKQAGLPKGSGFSGTASATVRKVHHPGKIVAAIVVTLVVLLALLGFGSWNWVDQRLSKSPWLTGSPKGPATSWLILGSDERENGIGGTESDVPGFRTDTILVLTKPKHGSSSLISIPRDTLVRIQGTYLKLNAVDQLYGQHAVVDQVEQVSGQKIDHVIQIKFGGLTQVVDALGGIKLCYDQSVDDPYSGLKWTPGCSMADGGTALAFSRMRYADVKGDFGRAERQRMVIAAITNKAMSADTLTNPSKLKKVAEASLGATTVDDKTNPAILIGMARAFHSASGKQGVTGSVYWTDPDYEVDGVGSTVLLDKDKNLTLFEELVAGTHKPGTVGTLAAG
ncbi:transcriptional regulator [Bifidobacterium aemilianum]|uniref:Transcriptional regulator n=1 Tax=Bifidobacterium aemilianum TaxID=2493120 RepID=A0A366KAE2_9BIFI|nr:LCP family protein [Bifidobacterium aemilianum]RBP98108.1 transcriptional regulator [Bifidobacterium aemilianum]